MAYYDRYENGERRFSGTRDKDKRTRTGYGEEQPRRYGERAERRFGGEEYDQEEQQPRRYAPRAGAEPRRYGERRTGEATRSFGDGDRRGLPRVGAVRRAVPPAVWDDELPERRFESSDRPAGRRAAPEADRGTEMPENLLVGRNPIREAIKSGRDIEKLLVMRGDLSGSAREIVAKAHEARIVVQEVDKSRLDAIYPNHQGMLAYVSAASYSTMEEVFAVAEERGEDPFLIILDGVTDPHNLGAIIRSAECTGAHGVIIPERRSAGLTPAAVKAAAGATEYVKIVRVINLSRTIEELKERGLWVVGAAMDGENAFDADLTGPTALVIGAEGEGISPLVLKNCDRVLSLPMKGHIESLNASVAAGVMMYAIMNARGH